MKKLSERPGQRKRALYPSGYTDPSYFMVSGRKDHICLGLWRFIGHVRIACVGGNKDALVRLISENLNCEVHVYQVFQCP